MGDGVQLGSAYGVVEIDASGVRQGVQAAEQSLAGMSRQFAMIGGALTLGVTAPLLAVGKQALGTAMDYQSSMAMFKAVSGATAAQMEQVRQTAVDLGKDMTLPATSAADAGEAMTELAKAGLSVEESMAAAKGALQLAAAGQLSEARAAQITANALNTFGLAGSEATRVADMLAAGANASSASVEDLAAGFQQGGSAFRQVGLSAEELITSIAALTNVGLTGSDAGTALKNAMIKLAAPTKEGAALMKQLGIDVFDAQGRMLPLPGVIAEFNQALAGMTDQQRAATLNTILLSDGAKALDPLLRLGAQGFTELQGKVTEQGAAAKLAAAQMEGLRGALAGLGSQLETVGLEIATTVLPILEIFVRKLAELVPKIMDVAPNIRNAVLAFLAVAAAAGPVIAAIGAVGAALAFLVSPIGMIVAAIATLAAAFAGDFLGIRTAVQGAIQYLQDLRAVVQDAGWQSSEAWEALSVVFGEQGATMIQSMVGVIDYLLELPRRIQGLIGIFGMWRDRTDSLGEALSGFMGTLGLAFPILQPLVPTLQKFIKGFDGASSVDSFGLAVENVAYALEQTFPALRPVTQALQRFGLWAQSAQIQIKDMARSMIETLRGVAAGIGPAMSGALERARGVIEEHSGQIRTVLGAAWEFITGFIRNKVMFVVNLVQAGLALLSGQWQAAWTFLGAALDNKFGWIVDLLTGGSTSIGEIFADLWPKVAELGGSAFGEIQSAISTFVSEGLPALQAGFSASLPVIRTLFETVFGTVQATLQTLTTTVLPAVVGLAQQLVSVFSANLPALQAIFATVFGTLGAALQTLVTTVLPVVISFVGQLVSVFVANLPMLLGIFNTVFGAIGTVVQFLLTNVLPIIITFVSGAVGVFTTVWPTLLTTVSMVVTAISGVIQSVLGVVAGFLQTHGAEIQTTLAGAWQTVGAIIQTALAIIQATVVPLLQGIGQFISAHASEIQGVLSGAWNMIKGVVEGALGFIRGILTAVLAAIRGDWVGAWDGIKNAFGSLWGGIQSIASGALDVLKNLFSVGWAALKTIAEGVWNGLKNAISGIMGAIRNAVINALTSVVAGFTGSTDSARAVVTGAFNAIQTVIGTVMNTAKTLTAGAWNAIVSVAGGVLGALKAVVVNAFTAIQTIVSTVWTVIKTVISTALQAIVGIVTVVLSALRGDWASAFNALKNTVEIVLQGVKTIFSTVLNGVVDIVRGSVGALVSAGTALVQGLIDGVKSMAGAVVEAAKGVVQGAIDAAKALLGIHSPSVVFSGIGEQSMAGFAQGIEQAQPLSLGALGAHIKAIVDELARLANSVIEPAAIQSAQAVTDPLAKILENVGKMVDGLDKLAGLETPVSIAAQLQAVSDAVKAVVDHYAWMANHVVAPASVQSAQAFSDPVAKIFDNLSKIVEGTARLGELTATGLSAAQITAQMTALGQIVESVVKALSDVAGRIPDLGAAATVLAQNAGPALDLIEPAISAFRALIEGGFTMNRADGPFGSLDTYTPIVERIRGMATFIQALAVELGSLALGLGTDLLLAMKKLAENVGPLLGVVGPTLDAYHDLITRGFSMDREDGPFGINDSYTPVLTRIRGLATFFQALASEVGALALGLGDELLAAMKSLGENVGPLLAVVTPTLDAYHDLITRGFSMDREDGPFGINDSYTPVLTRIQGLAAFFQALASEVGALALGLGDELLAAMKSLGENVGPLLAVVDDALAAAKTLAEPLNLPATTNMTDFGAFLAGLARAVGTAAGTVGDALEGAAKTLADNVAPVVNLVKGAVDALKALAGDLAQPPTVNLTLLGAFLAELARQVGTAAAGVKDDLQKAAKALAENAGPAVNLIKNTVEAMNLLAGDLGSPTPLNITAVATFLYSLIDGLEWVTEEIDEDLQKAAKAFAENVAPVLALVRTTFDIIKDLPNIAKTLTSWQYSRLPSDWLDQVTGTLTGIVTGLAKAQLNVPEADLTAAKGFSEKMSEVIGWLKSGIDAIQGLMNAKRIGPWLADRIVQDFKYLFEAVKKGQGQLTPDALADAKRFADDATAVAQELVRGLTAFSSAAATTGLRDLGGVLAAVVAALREAAAALAGELTALKDSAYGAGLGWASQLAAGIRAGLPVLQAALQAVADLFPHSPAKAGPLRDAPDWQAWMLGGMDRAAGMVANALGQVALPAYAPGYAQAGADRPLQVNFNGPISVREEADLVRLAGMISELIGGKAVEYRRLNTGWTAIS